ncbi:hypothetical protein H5410_002711, partial [Solanum commersonii]
FKWVFIVFKNLCCDGALGAVSRGRRCTQRFTLWRYGVASWNYSATRRLLPFIANLIFSFRAQHTGILGEILRPFDDSLNALGNPQAFFSSLFQLLCSFLLDSVYIFKTQVQQFKKDVSNSAKQDSIMNVRTRLNLLMQRSIVYSKTQVVTHHYQRISSSPYLLQMQSSTKVFKCPHTKRMIPFSHTMV